jgi:lipoate-protein ligase A
LIDTNPADMVAALKVPEHKLAKRQLDSAAERVVTLKALLGDRVPALQDIQAAIVGGFAERLHIAPEWGQVTDAEEALAARLYDTEIGTDAFVAEIDDPGTGEGVLSASHTGAGGTVTAYVRLEGPGRDRVREVLITGDFFVAPPRIVYDLEASLRGLPVTALGAAVERFFAGAEAGLVSLAPADFAAALEAAAARR